MNFDFLMNYVFSDQSETFPDGWGNQNTGFWTLRIGVNYYFRIKGDGGTDTEETDSGD
jgi:hypothetical protein